MAIKYNTYFSNAIVGQPMCGADIDIQEVNTTPKFAVGFGFVRADGNRYRYCQFGAAIEAGYLVGTDSPVANWITANGVTAPASAVAVSGDNIAPGNAGSRYFELAAIAAVSANQLAGNYVTVYGGTGVGATYRVKGNTLSGAIGTALTRVELYEPLKEALSTDSDMAFAGSPYNNLVKATSTALSCNTIAGITAGSASANQFAWVCEDGIIGVYGATALVGGVPITVGATAGMVESLVGTGATSSPLPAMLGRTVVATAAGAILGVVRIKAQ